MSFVHLHVHSEYSLLESSCRIRSLAPKAASMGQTALALTDSGVMYGAIDFYRSCREAGIKPIIGCEVALEGGARLVLLCRNTEGYHELCRIVSRSFTEMPSGSENPVVSRSLLREHGRGLVCLCCLSQNTDLFSARELVRFLKELFSDDLYMEIQNHRLQEESASRSIALRLHEEESVPLAATNDVYYLEKEDAAVQDVLACIREGQVLSSADRKKLRGSMYYLKSEQEMAECFSTLPEALENTARIAEKCNFDFEFGHYHLPKFPLPEGETDAFRYLRALCEKGLEERYGSREDARKQMEYELSVISQMGFVDYFLIVSDFVGYAKSQGIPVGPGRGSAAGSVVSYCLNITDVDPIRYSLYFERFLNPQRISMPDIDIDFCVRRRSEVIDYVSRKYGRDHVAQIVTFGTMAAKNAVRDVGRVLGLSYSLTDACAKAIPNALHITLDEALTVSKPLKELCEQSPETARLIQTAKGVEGMPRHTSTHAAGVVITNQPVEEYVPLAKNDGVVVTQYQMTPLEQLGLLKMDFLGLRNLTILDDAVKAVQLREPDFRLEKIPEDDSAVFSMLSKGRTCGVFQLESGGITSVCTQLRPGSIEDITAIIALYRPGPMESIPRFIECRRDPSKVTFRHPLLKPILSVTYGCIVYQEQVMEIFRTLAGFSSGQADMIRRAMSKKKEKEIVKERESFLYGDPERNIPGAIANGVPETVAGEIYDEILAFANYAFNKAHAVSYAIVSYRTAYMKCHYPGEYMCALLSSVSGMNGKVEEYAAECREMKLPMLPPDINCSGPDFTAEEKGIRFGLASVKNVGRGFAEMLCSERAENGAFTSPMDLCRRLSHRDLNKRALESLISAGALDGFGMTRRSLLSSLNKLVESASEQARKNVEGQLNLFGEAEESESAAAPAVSIPSLPEFSSAERTAMEKEMTGISFSGQSAAPAPEPKRAVSPPPQPSSYYRESAKEAHAPPPAKNMYLRLLSTEEEKLHRIKLISQMFLGPDMLTIYFEDTKKRLGARCLIHPAFVDEMVELLGKDNVVIK